jgi:type IV pilus assembly protein PilA
MQETLRRMAHKRATGDRGFTLIELLVVVVIIGVLVAIAIPLYLNYRKGAANKSVMADIRSAITAVEQYYTENGNSYPASTASASAGAPLDFTTQKATVSPGNTLSYVKAGSGLSYWICGENQDGGVIYFYNSATGGPVKKSSQASLADCVANGT